MVKSLLNFERLQDHIPTGVWSFCYTKRPDAIYNGKRIMVYLDNRTDKQTLFIPKGLRDARPQLRLLMKSTIGLLEVAYDVILADNTMLYHKVEVALQGELPAGEYEYILMDDAGALSTGILILGDLDRPEEYVNNAEYEQY